MTGPDAAPGTLIGTEVDLAKDLGVARGTVRRALQQLVESGLVERRVGKGIFVAERKIKLIEMLVPGIAEHWYAPAIRSAQAYAQSQGIDFLIRDGSGERSNYETNIINQLPKSRADAAIVVSLGHKAFREALVQLKLMDYPFVVLGEKCTYADINWLCMNAYQCGYRAASELVKLGHRDIACIASKELPGVKDCMQGITEAVLDAGIRYDRRLCVDIPSDTHSLLDSTRDYVKAFMPAFKDLMQRPNKPTAVVLPRERVAHLVLKEFEAMGIRVPQDISIVGHDHDKDDYTCNPRVSAVVARSHIMGEKAVQTLLAQSENDQLPKIGEEFDVDWCPAESTGPAPN